MRATALLLTVLVIAPSAAARRRAVRPPSAPILAAVLGTEATAANYGSTSSIVQRCTDDQPCITDVVQPGQTKRYAITGSVMRIGQVSPGSIDIASDGINLPSVLFLQNTKIIPGAYDLQAFRQRIGIVSDWAGAISVKSIAHNGTIQDLRSVQIERGVTYVDPSAVFSVEPNFQFEITDTVAAFAEWTNTTTGQVTRIPAVRVEDALTEAYLARVTPTTTLQVKNALMVQQGGVNLSFLPTAGVDYQKFVQGILIKPYAMISTTDIPAFAGGTGDGSLKITGAPEGQNLLPFYAWAFNDGIPYPLTRFQQAATARGINPGNTTPYQNAVWTGLRTDLTHHAALELQNMNSLPSVGVLTLQDEQGTTYTGTQITFPAYGSTRVTLDALVGTHALYSATLQMNDSATTDDPRVTGVALVTSGSGTTVRAPLTVSRSAPTSQYDVTATIRVRDNGQTFEQVTHPGIGVVQKLTSTNNPDAIIGNHGFDCTPSPDAVVNNIPKLLANYVNLTPAEQQEFSGDRIGFAPFAANGCDASKSQYLLFIAIVVAKHDVLANVTAEQYVALWMPNDSIWLNPFEAKDLLTRYKHEFATELSNTPNSPGVAFIESYLADLVDGVVSTSNEELWGNGDPLFIGFSAGRVEFYKVNGSGSTVRVDTITLPADALQRIRTNIVTPALIHFVDTHPANYGGSTSTGPRLSFNPMWTTQDATFVAAQEYVDHFLLPLQNSRAYLNTTETRCMITGSCRVRSYAPDLAAIMQPSYTSSWPTADALADQLRAWADGSDANGELFAGKDPFSYVNTGSPLGLGFLLKPLGGAVPFNLSAGQMTSAFAALRSFLIEYVTAHPDAYGGTANGYSLAIDPTWSSQDAVQVSGEQYVAKWLDSLQTQYFSITYKQAKCFFQGGCGTGSYAAQAADIFLTSPTFANRTRADVITLLRDDLFADDYSKVAPLYRGFSPINTTMRSDVRDVAFYLFPDGHAAATVPLAGKIQDWYALLRSFLVAYVDANPTEFGGTAFTGPALTFDPLWRTAPLTTSEVYLRKWFDPLATSRIYLSNREVRCAIRGTCGAPTIRNIIAANLVLNTTTTTTEDDLRTWLDTLTDGSTSSSNPELWPSSDPVSWDAASDTWQFTITYDDATPQDVRFGHFPSGQGPNLLRYMRGALFSLTEQHPEWYGGSILTGPDLTFNPTWATQDPN
jgi:hypothetical protein